MCIRILEKRSVLLSETINVYLLENEEKVEYNQDKEHWEDESGNPCRAVMIGRELAGFSFRTPIDAIDREIYNLTEEGRAYLQYNEVIGGDPFGFTVGMPVEADPELYGNSRDVSGMHKTGNHMGGAFTVGWP